MILDACEFQIRQLEEQIRVHTEGLVRGGPTRDDDQRTRGIIHGLKLSIGVVQDLLERAQRAEAAD